MGVRSRVNTAALDTMGKNVSVRAYAGCPKIDYSPEA